MSEHPGPNPYANLNDIVREQADDYDAESDNLTLFTAEGKAGVPKVSNVLNNLVKFPGGENPEGEVLTAKESMLALLKKAVRCATIILSSPTFLRLTVGMLALSCGLVGCVVSRKCRRVVS